MISLAFRRRSSSDSHCSCWSISATELSLWCLLRVGTSLSVDEVRDYLQDDELVVENEDDVMQAVHRWLEGTKASASVKEGYATNLFPCVRLRFCRESTLHALSTDEAVMSYLRLRIFEYLQHGLHGDSSARKSYSSTAAATAGLAHPGALGGGAGDPKLGTDYLEVMGSEKPHKFKEHTYTNPHWCDFCGNFLWGLKAQGFQCHDCGFNTHMKCSDKVPNDCMPDMKFVKRMFGVDLTTLVKAQDAVIPAVVEKCIQEIASRGLEHEGLYRMAGSQDDVEAIKKSFDEDGDVTDVSETAYDDINTITSVLQLFFRLLPTPLVTVDIYFQLINIVKVDQNQEQKFEVLHDCLAILPPSHFYTLKYLMSHLHRVAEAKHKNMMSPEELAIVFAPALLRSPETDPPSEPTAVNYERELIELLITHHNALFEKDGKA